MRQPRWIREKQKKKKNGMQGWGRAVQILAPRRWERRWTKASYAFVCCISQLNSLRWSGLVCWRVCASKLFRFSYGKCITSFQYFTYRFESIKKMYVKNIRETWNIVYKRGEQPRQEQQQQQQPEWSGVLDNVSTDAILSMQKVWMGFSSPLYLLFVFLFLFFFLIFFFFFLVGGNECW